jgi:hypothetical protein
MSFSPFPTVPSEPHCLNANHFMAFGMITFSFARLEWLIQISIAAVGQLDFSKTLIVTRSLPYQAKRDTLCALMNNLQKLPTEHKTQIRGFLDAADKFGTLRNNIAHAMWGEGTRPNTIKPMTILIKGGSGKQLGIEDDERDYTIEELAQASDKLSWISNSYLNFLRAEGYTSSIEQKILDMMASKTSADGA